MNGVAHFQRVFSKKATSAFVILACIAAKSLLIFFYTYTGKDKIYNLSAGYNLLHGKGWTNSFYYVDNVNQEVLEPFCYWPPGYGLLYTPFQAVFKTNLYLATSLLEIVAFIAFILICRGILATQQVSRSWINLSTILLTFTSHEFIEASLGTDLIGVVFLLGFFYLALLIWSGHNTRRWPWIAVATGACLFFAGFTRYMYVPVDFFAAALMAVLAYWKKNRFAFRAYLLVAGIAMGTLICAMIAQNAACGSPFYTGIKEQGVFWNNLSYWYPVSVASIIDLNFIPVQLEKATAVPYTTWLNIFNWINWILYVWIAVVAIRYFVRHFRSGASEFPLFEITGSLLSAAIIGELAILSLTNGLKYTVYGGSWTFIVEGRYHAFAVVFFQLFLLKKAAQSGIMKPRGFYPKVITVCFVFFVLNSLHQLYFTAKTATNFTALKNNSVREQDYVFFEKYLKKTVQQNPGHDILVASDDRFYPLLASMMGGKGLADIGTLNHRLPAVNRPSLLFVVFHESNEKNYAAYLQRNHASLAGNVAGTRFYMQWLTPVPGK